MSENVKPKRDFSLERILDALILTRNYFDRDGKLEAQRLAGDALLLRRLIYGDRAAASVPGRSDSQTDIRAVAATE